jgi:hypothetical protein
LWPRARTAQAGQRILCWIAEVLRRCLTILKLVSAPISALYFTGELKNPKDLGILFG